MNSRTGHLFSTVTLSEKLEDLKRSARHHIDSMTEFDLRGVDLEEYAANLAATHKIKPVTLLTDKIVRDRLEEARIDVSHDPLRAVRDRSRAHYVQGAAMTIAVPFTGHRWILECAPSTIMGNLPLGVIVGNEIHVTYEAIDLDPQKTRAEFDRNLRLIQTWLEAGAAEVSRHNSDLLPMIQARLTQRRDKFVRDRQAAEAVGFPVRERANPPQVYSVPIQRKKIPIAQPAPLGQPKPTDHVLDVAAYENILQTIGSMARVLELNPKAFAEMDEESLRFMLLVPLNIHYEGQATGETFNWEGKTDIIIKVGGRNIFIAECLVWAGAEYFKSKIEQLLGYTSWRDTKTAIIIFNRNKNLTGVLSQIPDLVKSHPNCKREVTTYKHETGFRFVLHHRDDKDRELTLTVLVFDVPRGE
jgi:hypothetical protein